MKIERYVQINKDTFAKLVADLVCLSGVYVVESCEWINIDNYNQEIVDEIVMDQLDDLILDLNNKEVIKWA